MKNFLRTSLATLVCILPFTAPAHADALTYKLDPNHTYVMWHINHFGFSNPSGKWLANGTINFDDKKPQDSKVDVTINIASIDTGIPALDEHLKSKAFFDVQAFPQATFVSDKVAVTGKNTAKVKGMLTVHGVTKPVTLDVKLNKIGVNPITEKQAIGFSAKTDIRRSEFGMDTLEPGLGDEIKINIEAEGQLAS